MTMYLYSYFRSSCSWRVRLALNLLKIPHEVRPINLLAGEHRSASYLKVNPLGVVPSLVTSEGDVIWQSLAIIDYIDKGDVLLPKTALERAQCWQIVHTICSEIQPLQNLAIGKQIAEIAGGGETGEHVKMEWCKKHNLTKLKIIENELLSETSSYCVGNKVTLADICLIPQLYSADRFGINLEKEFPKMMRIAKKLREKPEFKLAHPQSQPDCPQELR